jgi:aryl carrier-like protein
LKVIYKIWNKLFLLEIILDLLQQTLDMHPNSNIIHIGCDEVILTNSHPQCREKWMDIPERYIE